MSSSLAPLRCWQRTVLKCLSSYIISIKMVMILWSNIRLWSERFWMPILGGGGVIHIEDRSFHSMRRWFVVLKLLRFIWWTWNLLTWLITGNLKDSVTEYGSYVIVSNYLQQNGWYRNIYNYRRTILNSDSIQNSFHFTRSLIHFHQYKFFIWYLILRDW